MAKAKKPGDPLTHAAAKAARGKKQRSKARENSEAKAVSTAASTD